MKNKRQNDITFLINTFGLTFVLVAILVSFQPYLESDYRIEEVKKVDRETVSLYPEEIAKMITSKHKPVMLVAYASWCGYCRQLMPVVVDMVRNNELPEVEPLFVSLDEEPRKFSKYLVHNDYHTVFSPYVVDHGVTRPLSSAMRPLGSSFEGTIPYVGFFDKNGKMVAESTGVLGESQIRLMAKQLLITD
jgi:thiol-disulfide isomerase/thioredoxin